MVPLPDGLRLLFRPLRYRPQLLVLVKIGIFLNAADRSRGDGGTFIMYCFLHIC